jgi:hypothetical protein
MISTSITNVQCREAHQPFLTSFPRSNTIEYLWDLVHMCFNVHKSPPEAVGYEGMARVWRRVEIMLDSVGNGSYFSTPQPISVPPNNSRPRPSIASTFGEVRSHERAFSCGLFRSCPWGGPLHAVNDWTPITEICIEFLPAPLLILCKHVSLLQD